MAQYDRRTFHKHTFCIWRETGRDAIAGRQPDFSSRTGSRYYFTDEGVYRWSDHWARVANCKWRLEGKTHRGFRLGYARWEDFHSDNEQEKLYFISIDEDKAEYVHKAVREPGRALIRTATATAKRLREARRILETDDWAAYYTADIAALRAVILPKLIETDLTLAQIRASLRVES